jgi:RNA polymerase sigma-70 factor (ECF subfamily)
MAMSPSDEATFRSLYSLTFDAVARYCLRRLPADVAHDAVADVYLVAWRRIDDVPAGDEALAWLYGVARNVIRNATRSGRRSERLQARLTAHRPGHDPGPEPLVVRRDEDERLLRALDTLRETDREIVSLRAFEELTFAEIGCAVGCSPEAAKKRFARATRRLRSSVGMTAASTVDALPRATDEGDER